MKELHFEWIEPAKLRANWPTVKEGLIEIEKFTDAWIIEDLYMAIRSGSCQLHIATIEGEYKGFMVTQLQENYGVNGMHIWCAYSKGHDFAILRESISQVTEWAKTSNAEKITFSTSRVGWERQAKRLGFSHSPLVTYELKL